MKATGLMHTLNASIREAEAGGLIKESSAIKQIRAQPKLHETQSQEEGKEEEDQEEAVVAAGLLERLSV